MLKLDPLPKVITFDCYGTLVQWHRAVRQAAATVLSSHMAEASQERIAGLADRVREIATQHQQQSPFREYEAVLNASLNEALSEAGYKATSADLETLLATLGKIEPHPEVPAALSQLRERYRIGIISNTSDDLIAATVNAIGTPIDFVITAQQARAYKPDHHLFLHAHSVMGVTKDETIHVAMGQFSDLKVCHELGIRSVCLDRSGGRTTPSFLET